MRSSLARSGSTALTVVIAAGLTYFLDPDNGRQRRARARERLTTTASRVNTGGQRMRRGFFEGARRMAQQGKGFFVLDSACDEAVARRIRARVADTVSHAGTIGVSVHDGDATLHGDILRSEHEPLLRAARAVSGVREITDHLIERDAADSIWSRQVPHEPREPGRFDFRQEHWSPVARSLGGLVGLALLAAAVRGRKHPLGIAGGLIGSGLLLRGAINRPLRRVGPGRGVIDIHKTIVVDAPIDRVFRLVDAFQSFPTFMHHVRSVTRHDDGTSHWEVDGPGGSLIEWDALMTARRPNEMLAWRSLAHSMVEHSGVIQFEPIGDQQTRIDIRASYTPPAGRLGHAFARAVGADPGAALDHELERVKYFIETWSDSLGAAGPAIKPVRAARSPRATVGASGSVRAEDRGAADHM